MVILRSGDGMWIASPYNQRQTSTGEPRPSMARIYPFRALRYDTSRVRMKDVVTQPYDKITPEMQQRYYERSPFNLIRIILGKHEPEDTEPQEFLPAGEQAHNVYTRA